MTISVIPFTWAIIYFQPVFCPKFSWLIGYIVEQVYDFLVWHYYINLRYSIIFFLYVSSFTLSLSITFCLRSRDIYLSLSISSSFVSELFLEKFLRLLLFYQQFYFQSNHRLLLLFFESLFLKQFEVHLYICIAFIFYTLINN